MMKGIIYAAAVSSFVLAACTSCTHDGLPGAEVPDDGCIEIRFDADIPPMPVVATRSVDPDGTGVQNMTLFCFDSYGLFVATTQATLAPTSDDLHEGTFTARVPQNTRLIHFLGNQNMLGFQERDFYNKSEAQVMAALEGSSGMMIYWARFACAEDDSRSVAEQLKAQGGIELVRNHALISVDNPAGNGSLDVTGFVVCNTSAFGTVAPYHPEQGFVWPGTEPFVTLPKNTSVMSDILDVTTDMRQYVFECENTADKPVSVILRGHRPGETEADDLYYRVMLIDAQGEQLLIRRNHHYILHIEGELSYGQRSFGEALDADEQRLDLDPGQYRRGFGRHLYPESRSDELCAGPEQRGAAVFASLHAPEERRIGGFGGRQTVGDVARRQQRGGAECRQFVRRRKRRRGERRTHRGAA